MALGENERARTYALELENGLTRYGFPAGIHDSGNPLANAVTIQRILALTGVAKPNTEFIDKVVQYGLSLEPPVETRQSHKLWSELVFLGDEISRPDIVEVSKRKIVEGVIRDLGYEFELLEIVPAIAGLFGIKDKGLMRYYHTL